MKKLILFSAICQLAICNLQIQAQNIGINATGAAPATSAGLDVDFTNKGLLVPRVALTNVATFAPVTGTPVTGLLVYSTTAPTNGIGVGYYYWDVAAAKWQGLFSAVLPGDAWQTIGNAGTSVATNFLGTTDNASIAFRSNNIERMRITPAGEVIVGGTAPVLPNDMFVATSIPGFDWPINGYSFNNGGAIFGRVEAGNATNFSAIEGNYSGTGGGSGVDGNCITANGSGISGENIAAAGTGNGTGVYGSSLQSGTFAAGIWGENGNAAGVGIVGRNFAAAGAGFGTGVIGRTVQSVGTGVTGSNLNTTGTGVAGAGNNIGAVAPAGGAGGSFTGNTQGVFVRYITGGVGQGIAIQDAFGAAWNVGAWNGVYSKITGTGGVGTIVKDLNGESVTMYCPESPEILFQDYGEGKLVNGKVHIELDPILAKNVIINEKHPLRVYIQLEGDCKGVYVTNKNATGFDVVELNGGTSNIPFQYTVICNRADEEMLKGRVSHYADARWMPSAVKTQEVNQLYTGGEEKEPTKAKSVLQRKNENLK